MILSLSIIIIKIISNGTLKECLDIYILIQHFKSQMLFDQIKYNFL